MAGKMIAVGDNVVDCYLDDHVYYPGGNAVNVAVNCRRDGIEDVAYIGMFGNDGKAEHLKWALTQENVHFERSRTMYAPSGSPGVRLIDGDRKFVGGPRNTAQHLARIRLTPEDLDYIEQYGLCHTSCFSSIEYELPEGERAENGAEKAPSDRQEKRTVERENAGETYGATEKTGTSTKIRLHLKTGELEILHERVESEGE